MRNLSLFPHRIITGKGGFAQYILKSMDSVYSRLEGRFDTFKDYMANSDEQLDQWLTRIESVTQGSHVVIDVSENLMNTLCQAG